MILYAIVFGSHNQVSEIMYKSLTNIKPYSSTSLPEIQIEGECEGEILGPIPANV